MTTAAAKPVVIVGGGISGLTCAYRLKQAGVPFVLLEASDRLGGKVRTDRVDGYTMDMGADAILLRKPWAHDLARELGLDARIQPVERPPISTYVLHRGKPVPLPDGLALLAPNRWGPFLRSPLFTLRGKLRAMLDLVLPRRRDEADESLADFVTRRLGREMLDVVGEPMLAGVFNGTATRQSMRATFPQFPALEREYGSVIRGVRAKRAQTAATDERPFFSFQTGAQELVEAIADILWHGPPARALETRAGGPCHVRLSTRASSVARGTNEYRVTLEGRETIDAAAVIFTGPATAAASVLRDAAPAAAALLAQIRYAGIGTAYVAYRREDVPAPLDGYGCVIPSRERRAIDGLTYSTTKWADRAPADRVLIRVFFGGPHTRAAIALDDAALLATIRRELADILGITAEPVLFRAHRWADGYPQYDVGHVERVDAIEAALPPGLVVTGNAYRGVGVPDCVRQANEAAAKVIAFLKERAA